jgi:hypothetical protein
MLVLERGRRCKAILESPRMKVLGAVVVDDGRFNAPGTGRVLTPA